MPTGYCNCGAISYSAEGEAAHHALCHCEDCRRSAGAPLVGWIAFKTDQVTVRGQPVTYASSAHGRRQFCGVCGTGLFYTNAEMLPRIIDIQSATLDDAAAYPPAAQIQVAERLPWIETMSDLPRFERYPEG
ncbi:GFA family protein [Sphingomonas qilianensis]|uniref:GFA family protein n=1 Tax=Sphingomonas qilianensis TaxID=1736690 RepID=A0ABU9XVN2_9SPHN